MLQLDLPQLPSIFVSMTGIKVPSRSLERKLELPDSQRVERYQSSSKYQHNYHQCSNSVSSFAYHDCKDFHADGTDFHNLTTYLPHTFIISDLGEWDRDFRLHFSHFLLEDPSIAVFSESQEAPIPTTWRHKQPSRPWSPSVRYCWRKGGLQIRRPCMVRVVVGSRWQYRITAKAIRYWNAQAGTLLVDWNIMYKDYFAQAGKRTNKQRTHEIVKRFRKLEERTLVVETGAMWSSYGDWGIHQPTAADVALACKYEGRGFENGLDPLRERLSSRELKIRFGHLTKALKKGILKHFARKTCGVRRRLSSLEIIQSSREGKTIA